QRANLCLDCHTDNVSDDRRGPQFNVADGIGCEACHGGALPWLGTHVQGVDHKLNVAAGMYPMDQPVARAERCLACHVGNDSKFVAHRMMGAGHPPMPFELDTYVAIEPAHFTVTPSYVQRKGRPNDLQFWAIGQAVDVRQRMDLIVDQKHAPKGIDYELSLFDCQSCHHSMAELQWRARASTGLPPGRIKLYDATTVMLQVAAARVAPDAAKALHDHMLALHAATADNWDAVKREAGAVRDAANKLIPQLAGHEFSKDDARAIGNAVIATALEGSDFDYSGAQQQVMALESVVAAMRGLGFVDDSQLARLDAAMKALYAAVANDQTYSPDTYADALKAFKAAL
ncbi:MAG: hypothetical protein JO032_14540, partial [Alphaproteobacteria bacterium]|nr:hypothetical protein [Alphaproteobacteria bacterium]